MNIIGTDMQIAIIKIFDDWVSATYIAKKRINDIFNFTYYH
jgi:hypothetical protein